MTQSISSIIGSDRRFSDTHRHMLAVLADLMIPAQADLPAAADETILDDILRELVNRAPIVARGLDRLAQIAADAQGAPFIQLDINDQMKLIDRLRHEDAEFLRCFETVVAACYYRDDRVLLAHGLTTGAPFPNGRTVGPTDWTLLDPVRTRQPFFRIP